MNLLLKPINAFAAATLVTLAAAGTPASAQIPQTTLAECAVPNRPAMTTFAQAANPSKLAVEMKLTGTTMVRIDLDDSGRVSSAAVDQSSGSPLLDDAAVAAARESSFAPEVDDCKPVGGEYLFEVDFPNQ